MFNKVFALTLLSAALASAIALPAAAGGIRHHGGQQYNQGDRYGRGNWGGGFPGHRGYQGYQGYQQTWSGGYRNRHRGGEGAGLAIGLGILGLALGAGVALQPTYAYPAYPPPTAYTSCSVGGCYIWNGQWWVWHPRY